jgi:hypothetical protein
VPSLRYVGVGSVDPTTHNVTGEVFACHDLLRVVGTPGGSFPFRSQSFIARSFCGLLTICCCSQVAFKYFLWHASGCLRGTEIPRQAAECPVDCVRSLCVFLRLAIMALARLPACGSGPQWHCHEGAKL